MSDTDLKALKETRRNEAIETLISQAVVNNDVTDRLYWTLIHDLEHSPITTNLKQLEEIGIIPVVIEQLTPQEITEALTLIINGLAKLNIFLFHTNHLTDGELYQYLVREILVQEVRDLPTSSGVHEFIDITGGQLESQFVNICDRDAGLPQPNYPNT